MTALGIIKGSRLKDRIFKNVVKWKFQTSIVCVCVEEIVGLVKFGSWEIIWLRGQLEQELQSVNLEPRIWNREKSVSSEVRTTVEF